MKIVRPLLFLVAMVALAIFIEALKSGLRRLFHEGFWLGAAGSLVCFGVIVAFTVFNRPPVTDADDIASSLSPDVEKLVAVFPGPIVLDISSARSWLLAVLGSIMTAASLFAAGIAFPAMRAGQSGAELGFAICAFGILFFGLGAVMGVRLIGDGSLQLDKDGFSFCRLFRTRYRWAEVTNFGLLRSKNAYAVFTTSNPHRSVWSRISYFYASGRDGRLPDTYGLQAEELVKLLKIWQSLALVSQSEHRGSRRQPNRLLEKEPMTGAIG
jgi:uncharacterized membrane protein